MKKTLLTTSLILGLSSGAAFAGGIQIDPTGSGSIAGSKFLSDASLGSTFGNLLATTILGSALEQAGGTPTGMVYGHNSLGLGSFGIPGAELTFEFELAVLPSVTGTPNTIGEQLSFTLDAQRASTFRLYFDSAANADMKTGSGYGDGTLIAQTSAVSIQGTAAITNTTGGITTGNPENPGKIDDRRNIDTIGSNGSLFLDLDFSHPIPPGLPVGDFVDTNYIVNDLTSALVDLSTDNSLTTPYPNNTWASDLVVGNALAVGSDGVNNFQCSATPGAGVCGFQAKMNTTFITDAVPTPEPGTLALIGLGLGLLGFAGRRKQHS